MTATPPETAKPVQADALERAEKAWTARTLGATWEQAAQVAGLANGPNAVRAVRGVYGTLPTLEREEMRRLWRDRLEVVWRQVVADMRDKVPGSVTAAVRVSQAATRLDGLDAPTRISLLDPSDEEIERFLDEKIGPRHVDSEPDFFEEADVVDP